MVEGRLASGGSRFAVALSGGERGLVPPSAKCRATSAIFRLLLSLLVLLCPLAFAGQQGGVITLLLVRESDGLILFELSGSASSKPACATQSYWIIKNENSDTGRRQYAMLLAARTAGQEVQVDGHNACTRWSDGEDVNVIRVQ